jgi:hypothetical protein
MQMVGNGGQQWGGAVRQPQKNQWRLSQLRVKNQVSDQSARAISSPWLVLNGLSQNVLLVICCFRTIAVCDDLSTRVNARA